MHKSITRNLDCNPPGGKKKKKSHFISWFLKGFIWFPLLFFLVGNCDFCEDFNHMLNSFT